MGLANDVLSNKHAFKQKMNGCTQDTRSDFLGLLPFNPFQFVIGIMPFISLRVLVMLSNGTGPEFISKGFHKCPLQSPQQTSQEYEAHVQAILKGPLLAFQFRHEVT